MAIFGAVSYVALLRMLILDLRPFASERSLYNTTARLPYYAACLFMCLAGALDPLGVQLFFLSTVPAFFGGLSGLLWGDAFLPRASHVEALVIQRSPKLWIAAFLLGVAFIAVIGHGIEFRH